MQAKAAFEAAKAAVYEASRALRDPPLREAVELVVGAELLRSKAALAAPTLQKLLDYREEDNKECMFEVGRGGE